MTLLLYLITATLTLLAWHRWVTPLSRGAAIVILLLPFPFVGQALVTDRVYGGYDMLFLSQPWSEYSADYGLTYPHNWYLLDQVLALAPWQHAVRDAFAHHEWPLWNPGMSSGDILAAGMQVAPYNPLNLIALLLPLDLAATFTAAMVFFLAGLFTFAFARELECGEGASLIASAGFAFCGAVVFWVGWTHMASWALLPFVLLAIRRASFPLLTIAFTLLILFGHPETMLHVVAIAGAYLLTWFTLRRAAVVLIAGAVALLLTAIFLLPFLAILDKTWQYELFKEQAQHPSSVTAAEIGRAVGATFIPYFGGASWYNLTRDFDFGMARVGSIVLALAVVAAVRFRRRREVKFFLVLAAVALIAAWNAPPVATLLRKLPLFAVAKNERLGFAAAFALSILAAMAVDALARSRAIVLAVGAALMIATALLWRARIGFGVQPKTIVIGLAAEILGIIVILTLSGGGRVWALPPSAARPGAGAPTLEAVISSQALRMTAVYVILGAIAVQRVAEDGFIYPSIPRRQFYPEVPLIRAIPRDPLYRVVGTANLFIPNAAGMFGLQDVRGYASMTFAPYKQTTALWCPTSHRSYLEVTDLTLPFLSFLGVRHAITPREMEPPPGWRVVADDRKTRLMESSRAVPRVFAPRVVRFMNSSDTIMEEMQQASDFAEKAWIQSSEVMPQDMENGSAAIDVKRNGSSYKIHVDARSGAYLVISDVAWPGWRAYLDGRRVKIATANLAFLSVYVPQGKHRIRLVYLPEAFVRGRAISFTTLAVLLGAIAIRAAGSRRRAARAR